MKDKKVLSKLRDIASKLPQIQIPQKVRVYGQMLLEKNNDAKDAQGNPIDAKKYYHVTVPVLKNHYKQMKRLFEEGGVDKVNEYIIACNDLVLQRQKAAA